MNIQACTEHALAKINLHIEADVLEAKIALNLPGDDAPIAAALRVLDDVAPLFVHKIVVTGHTLRDRYEDTPGMAFYETTDDHHFKAEPYSGLEQAREKASLLWAQLSDNAEAPHDGQFTPVRVALKDHANRTLQVFDIDPDTHVKGWLKPAAPEKAKQLMNDALDLRQATPHEAGSDTLYTARTLRDRAVSFIEQASSSKLHARAIP